jgi:hypothetical protein
MFTVELLCSTSKASVNHCGLSVTSSIFAFISNEKRSDTRVLWF